MYGRRLNSVPFLSCLYSLQLFILGDIECVKFSRMSHEDYLIWGRGSFYFWKFDLPVILFQASTVFKYNSIMLNPWQPNQHRCGLITLFSVRNDFSAAVLQKITLLMFTLYYEHLVKVKGADITGLNCFLNVLSSTDRLRNSLAVGVKWASSKQNIILSSSFVLLMSLLLIYKHSQWSACFCIQQWFGWDPLPCTPTMLSTRLLSSQLPLVELD